MVKRTLMIAYHYPPVGLSSGVHRTLKFSQYLPEYGWEPIVLTVKPGAYELTNENQLADIPSNIIVKRALALDTARHLSIMGRYPGVLALPDRWVSWWFHGVLSGLNAVWRYKPSVLWSTYPIATAHLIGLTLHRLTGLPWVADFRDSMTEEHYPAEKTKKKIFQWIEQRTVNSCQRAVFTTPGTLQMYAERYPEIDSSRWVEIANGYDEEKFQLVESGRNTDGGKGNGIVLVHSGVLYPSERDPMPFFYALADLLQQGLIGNDLKIIFRASGHDDLYRGKLGELGIDSIVRLMPPVPYDQSLNEMLDADGLLIFQASNCNHQIPAKIYEYIRARKPILALTDPGGDTASVLRNAGIYMVAQLDSREQIKTELMRYISLIKEGKAPVVSEGRVSMYSRKKRAEELVKVFDGLCGC